ncbi:helix-turn-helix transcriptional regulator [Weissella paramesenteroides]|uniref:XRE family transcriptional regulator n=1 Tax=Weissella thailandensis TaxID=89061 RepID=A0ABX9I5Z2_9LACO|nr:MULTISPECIES: helix-turn-helix transcriptional regulator [Weissella]NKY90824.1 helix-turn-helix transcriptional regulator [Weissella thailandensis]RDS59670.1 XRE family transcriptional regulator [Weissella thailandensis]WEA52279.1 helix-turn-helix transcriptional regulator [Weissella paramesenteroides]GEP75582.1 transcriptional regulator [Weissella thailandensis]
MTTYERIQSAAKKRGMNLREVAKSAGLKSETAIYRYNQGVTPRESTLRSIADVLNVSVDYLLGNTDDMHANKKADTSSDDLKEYFDEHPVLKFDGKEIPDAEMKIIKRILEDMDD